MEESGRRGGSHFRAARTAEPPGALQAGAPFLKPVREVDMSDGGPVNL